MGFDRETNHRALAGALALLASACAVHDPAPDASPDHRQVRIAAERGQWDRAAEVLGVEVEDASAGGERPGPETCLATARGLRAEGDEEGARAVLDLALDEFPGHPDLLELRAETLIHLDYRHAAERDLEECLAVDGSRLSAWLRLGELRLQLGLPTAASRALREAERLGASGHGFQLLAARVHRELGADADAARHYALAVAPAAEAAPCLLVEAASLWASPALGGDEAGHARARAWLARALELVPDDVQAHFASGLLHEARGERADALACYRRTLELDPEHLGALTGVAVLSASSGHWVEAEDAVRRALELEENPARRRALAALLE